MREIKLRPWQADAQRQSIDWYKNGENKHFVINAAPGSGKTILAISMAKKLSIQGYKILSPLEPTEYEISLHRKNLDSPNKFYSFESRPYQVRRTAKNILQTMWLESSYKPMEM